MKMDLSLHVCAVRYACCSLHACTVVGPLMSDESLLCGRHCAQHWEPVVNETGRALPWLWPPVGHPGGETDFKGILEK